MFLVSPKRSSPTADDGVYPSKRSRTGVAPDEDPVERLAPSSSDFESLAEIRAFVDKSLALHDFMQEAFPIHLLLRPRRSGKTTLLTMFRAFFEHTNSEVKAYRKELFEKNNLIITKDVMFKREFGRYPVVYLDFSSVCGFDMANLLQKFKRHVTNIVLEMEGSGLFEKRYKLPRDLQTFLQSILNRTIPDDECPMVLRKLTRVLHVLHERAIVLMDEYDTPVSHAARHGYSAHANEFFCDVLSNLLKNNGHLRGALLVGMLHDAKAGWLSGLNNISVFPLSQTNMYSTACMFTEIETRKLFDRQDKLQKLPFQFDDLREWYNGYSTKNGVKLFNPWSISSALSKRKLGPWWAKSACDTIIQNHIKNLLGSDDNFRRQCQMLLLGRTIDIKLDIAYASTSKMSAEQLWTFMFYAGYLKNACPISEASNTASICIPNKEVQSQFRQWIRDDFDHRMNEELRGYSALSIAAFIDGKFQEFATHIGKFLLESVPKHIFGSVEAMCQDSLFAYLDSAVHALQVDPEWATKMVGGAGDGPPVMTFHRKDKGIIIAVKYIADDKKQECSDNGGSCLSTLTTSALSHCDTRLCRAAMPKEVTTLYEYGLAFVGPYCRVAGRALQRNNGGWSTQGAYTVEMDGDRRKDMYCEQ